MKCKPVVYLLSALFLTVGISHAVADNHGGAQQEEMMETGNSSSGERGKKKDKPKFPDLEVLKGSHTVVVMRKMNKEGQCSFDVQSKVKNVGKKSSGNTTLRFKMDGKEFKKFDILALKPREASVTKNANKQTTSEGTHTFAFSVDAVADEPVSARANNSLSFECPCGKKKQRCKKKR